MKDLTHSGLINVAKKNTIQLFSKNKSLYIRLLNFIYFLKKIEHELESNYHPLDEMKCPVHFCHGQESVPAALNELLTKSDYLFSHHRSHGYYLSKKCPPEKLFAELYGKGTGANFGIAGSQDISYPANNFYSGAILAGSISIAVGTALSLKISKKKNIVVCGFGESATDQGVFWESLNYSSLEGLPLLYVCENNNLSVFTPQKNRQAGNSIASKADSFGIKSTQVYGNDPLKVYQEIDRAIKYIKKNKKPFLVEAYTYRVISHVGPLADDTSNMKNTKEYKFWIKNGPFDNFKKILLKKKYISNLYLAKIEKDFDKKIKQYFNFARNSKFLKIKNFSKINYCPKESNMQKKIKKISKTKISFQQKIEQVKGY